MARPRKKVLIVSASEMGAKLMNFVVNTQHGLRSTTIRTAAEVERIPLGNDQRPDCVVVIRSLDEPKGLIAAVQNLSGLPVLEMRCSRTHTHLEPLFNAVIASRDDVASALDRIKTLVQKKRGPVAA